MELQYDEPLFKFAFIFSLRRCTKGTALSFAVITPHWPGRPAWEALAGSRHRTHVEVIPLREHGYFEAGTYTRLLSAQRRHTYDTLGA